MYTITGIFYQLLTPQFFLLPHKINFSLIHLRNIQLRVLLSLSLLHIPRNKKTDSSLKSVIQFPLILKQNILSYSFFQYLVLLNGNKIVDWQSLRKTSYFILMLIHFNCFIAKILVLMKSYLPAYISLILD